MNHLKYEAVIGLEIHAQLNTNSKLFCTDSIGFGAEANTQVSAISLSHPGTLPKMNEKVADMAIQLGLALNCEISEENYFARKHYFYPDLPKAYQISQHTTPICNGGHLEIEISTGIETVILNRIHIEEDAGKSIHDQDPELSFIDLNRAGTPLLEIVTEPCIHSAEAAAAYFSKIRQMVRWLNICDGNMEEGSMRCDANVSIRLKGEKTLGTKVEVKNLNSIKNVRKVIEIELERLIQLKENNEEIIQETRGFNPDNNTTFSQRIKEDADDYRYFNDPDIPAFLVTKEKINEIKNSLPILPNELLNKYKIELGLTDYDATLLTEEKSTANYFENVLKYTTHYKAIVNWMFGPLKNICNEKNIEFEALEISYKKLAQLINYTQEGKINFQNASTKVLKYLMENKDATPIQAAQELNLIVDNNEDALQKWIEETIAEMPEKVKEYKAGKKGLIGLFAGNVKKKSQGKADMKLVNELLEKILN